MYGIKYYKHEINQNEPLITRKTTETNMW